jgi:hypothetical protein
MLIFLQILLIHPTRVSIHEYIQIILHLKDDEIFLGCKKNLGLAGMPWLACPLVL